MEQTEFAAYEQEWDSALQEIKQMGGPCERELRYFISLAEHYYQPQSLKNRTARVILLDLSFPAEIIRGLGAEPLYLPGGSFASANWAEKMVPRDTDSVIKSVLGLLTNETICPPEDAIVLVPLNCDSMRKFPAMLEELGYTVLPVELPSSKNAPDAEARWRTEVRGVTQQLERKLKRTLSRRKLEEACRQSAAARCAYGELVAACEEKRNALSGTIRLFVAHSYLWASNPKAWTANVRKLTERVKTLKESPLPKPQILVIGSPVYFPNYKIPFLLESLRMDMAGCINPISVSLLDRQSGMELNKASLLDRIAGKNLAADISPAFVENDTLFDTMKQMAEEKKLNGVILHILKGQIEYDFEMRRYEEYLESQDIPIFRLETDYNYQDVEQLRIRLEAFSEMATHKMRLNTGRSA